MPDNPINALFPQPPQAGQPSLLQNPAAVLDLAMFPERMRAIQLQNATGQFQLSANEHKFVTDGVATLADHPNPTMEDVRNLAVTMARNTNIPSPIITGWMAQVQNDPNGIKAALVKLRNVAMGSAATSVRVPGPPDATGAPTTISQGQANYLTAGVGGGSGPSVAPRQPGIATGLPPGQGEAQTAEAQSGQAAATALQTAASQVPQQHTQLDLMRNDLKIAQDKFGPTMKYEKVANVIAGRVLGFNPTMSKDEIAAAESFDKVAKQIAMTQAGTLHATDQTLTTALGANPNTDLSAYGNEGIINMLHGNADYIATAAREWNKARASGVGANQYWQWLDGFNRGVDPRVFQFMRMTKGQQATLLQNIPDKYQFEQALVDAARRGWIKLPKAQ